jgi:predicted transcriptional regulator
MKYNPFETGKRLKDQREKLQLFLSDVAEKVHVADDYLSRVESGHIFPDLMTFVRLCSVLGLDDPGQMIAVTRTP